jgi:alpha-ketoglutaric semialdehyde dehydrogenase
VFSPMDPRTGEALGSYPISPWADVEDALVAGMRAFDELRYLGEEHLSNFLERFADRIDRRSEQIVDAASAETALPVHPRLADVELPRTTDQLRQAAAAARMRSWKRPVISSKARIASLRESLPGVVCVFGPNNFPLAFNSASGGDFAAAVATGHPIIAKANPGHPATTRILAEEGNAAAMEVGLPSGFLQLIYRTSHADGARLVADERVAATAYTGSRAGGLALKAAADRSGNLIYLEMSSVNPVVVLPGAWRERGQSLA